MEGVATLINKLHEYVEINPAIFLFRIDCNTLCLSHPPPPPSPPNFAPALFTISPGYYSRPKSEAKMKTMAIVILKGFFRLQTVFVFLCKVTPRVTHAREPR